MVVIGGSSIQSRILSSFVGGCCFLRPTSCSLHPLFRYDPGEKHMSMRLSRKFSGLADFLFNRRAIEESPKTARKRLRPGKVSPRRPVPDHILRPPYVNSIKLPGIASGPEVHDEIGIEKMKASGRLAALVLQHAGSLVKALQQMKLTKRCTK